nr:NAD(P)H-hydrate dehydratase [Rhodoferax sp.]
MGSFSGAPLFANAQTREAETSHALQLPPYELMRRAGLAVAKFAVAIAPHAKTIWIACGPGNNGGDGYEAAMRLKLWGKYPVVTCLGDSSNMPADAAAARKMASDAGVVFSEAVPPQYDICIDALFGIGRVRPWDERGADWVQRINAGAVPTVSIDLPSGLDADTGATHGLHVKADYTLSLLTLKPGLFTADGRAASGEIWFNNLGIDEPEGACARLNNAHTIPPRAHNTHKGSYGDVCIVGGSGGMTGAALLAARAALQGGAGRVYVGLLGSTAMQLDICQPELMFRALSEMAYENMTVVAGCGGGDAIVTQLSVLLTQSARLVLDADALNAIAKDVALQNLLTARPKQTTVLTPHPLEAARLMNLSTADIQANRLRIAQAMADRFACTVVLKGSGTVIAAPDVLPHINTTGNARLATAGAGDVLAGLIGARLAAGRDAFFSAGESVFRHGKVADDWVSNTTMTAQSLAQAL